ncbi:MAG TPA: hypothetical protein VLJ86_00755 [Ramlibacter sp.]|nr:hypothetical protein [Ramlibacter sp.]
MNPTPRPTAADIASQALQSRRGNAPGHDAALTAPVRARSTVLDELTAPAVGSARPGLAQRFHDHRHLRVALAPVRKEVISAAVEVYKLELLSRVDAMRDRVAHNFLLAKAEHGEQAAVAAQLFDERLLKLLEVGEDRLGERCAARLSELNEQFERGQVTADVFQANVLRNIQRYEELAQRLAQRVAATRRTADAIVAPATDTIR